MIPRNAAQRRTFLSFLLFTSPWIVGFLVLNLYPLLSSVYFSFADYSVLSEPVMIGTANYQDLFTDELFWKALSNTLFFALVSIPVGMAVSLSLAILLNFGLPGKGVFRTIFFLPSLLPMVCLGVLWQWLLNGDIGLVNGFLQPVCDGLNGVLGTEFQPPNWLLDPTYSKWGLVLAQTWTVGNSVVIYLAGLQDVPQHLYESAEIDGATFGQKILHVTLPMISPVIYFNGIMAVIGSLQVFATPFVITGGSDGPERSLLFIATYIYRCAFEYWNMGYASAMALILFLLILGLTLLVTRLSERHTHYELK
jgi:multiple sugar transport system permease protein